MTNIISRKKVREVLEYLHTQKPLTEIVRNARIYLRMSSGRKYFVEHNDLKTLLRSRRTTVIHSGKQIDGSFYILVRHQNIYFVHASDRYRWANLLTMK